MTDMQPQSFRPQAAILMTDLSRIFKGRGHI